ncbi:hypothetical protein [Natrinema versiforme]|uniref:Uncharacterized protein n=1 Tax=Natrinema versiforme JCM 10478 TaxID=1227496 RepID=L9XTL1_9EURY|nr:hypothetical protein [Natrinema versiforme]ELY64887.1 hypothetical protein C489_15771 [Natrinema versiforme JCM 10478]
MAGRPPDVTDEEILQVFRESDEPVLFTGEVSDQLSIGRDGTLKRLKELEDDGHLSQKQRGNVMVWWLLETK